MKLLNKDIYHFKKQSILKIYLTKRTSLTSCCHQFYYNNKNVPKKLFARVFILRILSVYFQQKWIPWEIPSFLYVHVWVWLFVFGPHVLCFLFSLLAKERTTGGGWMGEYKASYQMLSVADLIGYFCRASLKRNPILRWFNQWNV